MPENNMKHPQSMTALISGLILLAISTLVAAQEKGAASPFPGGEEGDMWVMAGQSNMLGCALLKAPIEPDPRIMEFPRDGKWVIAREPFNTEWANVGTDPASEFPVREHLLLQR